MVEVNGEPLICHYNLAKDYQFSDRKISYPDYFPYFIRPAEENSTFDNYASCLASRVISGTDVEVSIPNVHVFFSILENFIRNSAKHHKEKLSSPEDMLEIRLSLSDYDDNLYEVRLSDNVSIVSEEKIRKLREKIQSSILDKNNKPLRKDLGIADMKINSFLLSNNRGFSEGGLSRSLDIQKEKIGEDAYLFKYVFKIAKSKKVCWIGRNDGGFRLKERGVYLFETVKSFRKISRVNISTFEFAILEPHALEALLNNHAGEEAEKEIQSLFLQLPFRVILNTNSESLKKFNNIRKHWGLFSNQVVLAGKKRLLSSLRITWKIATIC
ncbi:MAG: hypothetical protein IPJ40_24335 [Saprospirales bacterium]|nr:hypothetical protein [Saprospirales bacterium]